MTFAYGPEVVDWVARKTHEYGRFGSDIGIGWKRGGEFIAGVVYADWNGVNVECHIASDGSRRWMTRQYLYGIFHYPFVQLGARRITVCIGEQNRASRRFVGHLGFEEEARLKDAHPTGDLLIFRMFRENCRWISHESSPQSALAA